MTCPEGVGSDAEAYEQIVSARGSARIVNFAATRREFSRINIPSLNRTPRIWRADPRHRKERKVTERSDADHATVGTDTVTGEPVTVPLDARLLVCGVKGSGKSRAIRPLVAAAARRGKVIVLDGGGDVANLEGANCSVAAGPDAIRAAIDALRVDLTRRREHARRQRTPYWTGGRSTALIESGGTVLAALAGDATRRRVLAEIFALGRAVGMPLWWVATDLRTDLPPELRTGFDHALVMRTANIQQSRLALGGAIYDHAPHEIPGGPEGVGLGYLTHHPNLIQT